MVLKGKLVKNQHKSAFGILRDEKQHGFSLIEILLALFILGMIFSIGIPRLSRVGATPLDIFLVNLNALTLDASQRAIAEQKTSKILINFRTKPMQIQLRMVPDNKTIRFIEVPSNLEIEELFINKKNEPG